MYIDGRLRTGSRPSRTWISLAVYLAVAVVMDSFPQLRFNFCTELLRCHDCKSQFLHLREQIQELAGNYLNSVPCPFRPTFSPSISSQSTSWIGGGTTRVKPPRLMASNPLPAREVTSYFSPRKS